jgi:DNA (cytosine-5)-methyltransferase 1
VRNRLVLSVFPGIDLLGRAFEEEGYCVVRGGDPIFGGDVRGQHFPAGVFEGVIGGDPCQDYSALAHLVRHQGYSPRFPDMTPEYERIISEVRPDWFIRENVPAAPVPRIDGYEVWNALLTDAHVGGVQPRERRICWGMPTGYWRRDIVSPFSLIEYADSNGKRKHSILADARTVPVKLGSGGRPKGGGVLPHGETGSKSSVLSIEDACEAQGLPRDFTKHMPFTMDGKRSAVGNGVPLPMGRAIAKAVRRATS